MRANISRHTLATSINLERDDQKLWRLVNELNDEDIQRVTTPWKKMGIW